MDTKGQAKPQIQAVLEVLLDSTADKTPMVADGVNTAIRKIAKKHPNDVLSVCCQYCRSNSKMTRENLSDLLQSMEFICQEYVVEIDGDIVILLIDFALETMTLNNAYEPLVQMPASMVLVALGGKHCIQVIETLLQKMEKGVIPHYAIPLTLGSLAGCNAYGLIPYLKHILETIIPLLPVIKLDYHKNAFSYALGRFSDALNEYVSNINQAPDPTITIEMFQSELAIAYDVISSSWLYSRDIKVVESVLTAMSSIFSVLSFDKVCQQVTRIIPLLLNLYKKQKDPLTITRCLGSVIQVTSLANGTLLEPLLISILHCLGDLVCVSPDYAQPELLRNHSEVLRCYDRLALHFTDHCLDYLITQLKNNNDKEKIKSLLILTHLCHSSENVLKSRITVFLQLVLDLSYETNVGIQKAVLKAIVAFAYKGMLPQGNEQKYLTFIVKLCCKQVLPKNGDPDQQELLDLQTTADNTLYMLSTSVIDLEEVLWQLLLKCFLMNEFSDACVTLLRCLTHLAARKNSKDTCEGVFIRCIALLAQPLIAFRGTFILNFLKNIKLWPSESYRAVWDTKIIHLLKYLEQNYDHFQEKEWEDLIYDFITLVIQSVNDIKFNETLVSEAKAQLLLYNTKLPEKCLLLKCLALITCHVKNELVLEVLNSIIGTVKLSEGLELGACASAIGICSRSHLNVVIEKLGIIRKDISTKKSKLLQFSFMNSQKGEIESERIRLLILASYTEICNEAPGESLLQTVQHEILDFAVNEMNNCKDFVVRHACLKTIGAVADALHPNRNSLHIQMQDRDTVLKLILKQLQLHSGPEYIEMYPVTLPVITSLIRLPPALESDQRIRLLKHCFNNVFNAAAVYCKINVDHSANAYYGDLKMVPYVCASFSKLNFVVQEILTQNLTPATLDDIVTLLEPWMGRKKAEQRLPALETLRDALQTYLDNVKFAYEGPTTFTQSGFLLARVLPRCTDPNKNIRKVAVEAVRLVLCITARYEGHMREHDKLIGQALQHIQEKIDSDEPKLLFNLTTDLAHVITIHIPHLQLPHFVNHLIDAVLDVESSSSSGSSIVLNTVLKNKSGDLLPHVADLLIKLLGILDQIKCSHTRACTLRAILSIAIHHSKVAVGIVLGHSLPYEQHIRDCWAVFSNDNNLVCDILEQFKKIFKNYLLYDEFSNGEKIATIQPLQVICAMAELFKNSQLQDICKQQFSEIFSILYITLASYVNTIPPVVTSTLKNGNNKKDRFSIIPNRDAYKVKPSDISIQTFRTFLCCSGYSSIAESLLTDIRLDKLEQFIDLVPVLIENICIVAPQYASWLVANIAPYSKSDLEPQRVAVAAFLAAVVKFKTSNHSVFAENVLEMLLTTQNDSSCLVRQVGLQGLGYAIEFLPWELVSRHCENILNAFMQGLDYNNINNESGVALEAMLSFSKLLKTVNEQYLQSCQVTAAMRIKPLFEQEDNNLREASLLLIGDLAASINHERQPEAFKEQVFGTLITLLLHLCDDNPNVVKACKYSLRKVGPFLDSIELNSMIQTHLLDEGTLNYTNFITDLVKLMAKELLDLFPVFLMTCVSYYKSSWVEIRSFAALLTGLLYSHLDEDSKTKISFDTVCYRLLQLLKDENPQVKMRAIQATACLYIT